MPGSTDFPTAGKIAEVRDGVVVFNPRGTTYALHLKTSDKPAVGAVVELLIRVTARKVWTVPSGGGFITPIEGPPRILQGRVRYIDEKQIVIACGANVIVDLPTVDSAIDLATGGIEIGKMVNVTALPGATTELARSGVSS